MEKLKPKIDAGNCKVAGESTLSKCIAGIYPFDSGELYLEGERVNITDPAHANDLGIEVVHQDLARCDNTDIVHHLILDPGGPLCRCGARGCWEALVGNAAIVRAVGRDPGVSDIDDVLADVAAGHRRTLVGLRRIWEWVGLGLASLINLFNPEVVVLGGSLGSLYPAMETSVRSAVGRALGPMLENVAIVRSELGADAQLLVGAEVAFADLLYDPVGTMRALGAPSAGADHGFTNPVRGRRLGARSVRRGRRRVHEPAYGARRVFSAARGSRA